MQSGNIILWKMKVGWFRSVARSVIMSLSIVSVMFIGIPPTLAGEAFAAAIAQTPGLRGATAIADSHAAKPLRTTSKAQIEATPQNSAITVSHTVIVELLVSAEANQVNEAPWNSV